MNNNITFKVDDMHCASCPKLIQMDLRQKKGVLTANASLDTKLVDIEYDNALISLVELISTIKESGYTATEI